MSFKEELMGFIATSASKSLGVEKEKFKPETNIDAEFDAKSINFVQIIGQIEDEYELEVDFMKFRNAGTIEEQAAYIDSL